MIRCKIFLRALGMEFVMSDVISQRLAHLRKVHGIPQSELSEAMGFKDRQTLSAIESGARRIKADELIRAASKLGVSPEVFTDPYRLVGEGRFSWRHTDASTDELCAFEEKAGVWIAMYRRLCEQRGECNSPILPRMDLTKKSSFEEAQKYGEELAEQLELGPIPARNLEVAVQKSLKTLVLHVNSNKGISGAACQVSKLNVILINRDESDERRHFDLAHELFHILTWDVMPPEHFETTTLPKKREQKRVEDLANNFAAGLLMPSSALARHLETLPSGISALTEWLNKLGKELEVSAVALKWRLVNLGELSAVDARKIDDSSLRNHGQVLVSRKRPPLFSAVFVETLFWGLAEGKISARKAARLLDMTIDDMLCLLDDYGLETNIDL
ncbi:MAG: DNA-binding protein [Rhodopirellula sp.]|nr:DNA-binding protein [Rhodopirellula sp.]